MIEAFENNKCIILNGTCTWCGRRDKYGEVSLCPIARNNKSKGFNIDPPLKAIKSYSSTEYECFYCGIMFKKDKGKRKPSAMTRDHVIPISRGGKYIKNNTVGCCHLCNKMKGSLMPKSFLMSGYLNKIRKNIVKNKLHKMNLIV